MNAAHDVRPMNGGIFFHPSTSIGRSSRGNETFTTFSATSDLAPVMLATRAASIGGAGSTAAEGGAGDGLDATADAEDARTAGGIAVG